MMCTDRHGRQNLCAHLKKKKNEKREDGCRTCVHENVHWKNEKICKKEKRVHGKMRGQCKIRWMRERSAEYVCMKMCIRKTGRSVRKNKENTTKNEKSVQNLCGKSKMRDESV